jgi:hypothetical protein
MIGENVIRELIEKAIPRTNSRITLKEIINKNTHYVVTLYGGLNGCGRLHNYLKDVQEIINQFDHVWMVTWDNDCPDDVWILKIGIR